MSKTYILITQELHKAIMRRKVDKGFKSAAQVVDDLLQDALIRELRKEEEIKQ